MAVQFKLKPPLPSNVFNNRQEKAIGALASSIIDDIPHALQEKAYVLSASVESMRDGNGEFFQDHDTPQGVYDNMHGTAMAYLAYRMGDAMPVEISHGDEVEAIEVGDKQGKAGFVRSWMQHLDRQYGGEMAQAMMHEVTQSVDHVLYDYFPKMKDAEPAVYKEHLKGEEPGESPSFTRRTLVKRAIEKKGFGPGDLN